MHAMHDDEIIKTLSDSALNCEENYDEDDDVMENKKPVSLPVAVEVI
jgi:hypothetical protein